MMESPWHTLTVAETIATLWTDADSGLTGTAVTETCAAIRSDKTARTRRPKNVDHIAAGLVSAIGFHLTERVDEMFLTAVRGRGGSTGGGYRQW
jgi:hypothetical protein